MRKFIARQLARPSGLFGRLYIARWLDRSSVAMNELTLAQLSLGPQDRTLEVGFGSGDLMERILTTEPGAYVAGVDLSIEMVNVVRRRLRRHIADGRAVACAGDIEALPFGDGEFTKLCSVNTLYFWRNPSLALAECRRVLKRDGLIALCFNAKEDLARWPGHKHGFRLYELSEVEELLKDAGFTSIEVATAKDSKQGTFHCVRGLRL
ncbi:MAG: class I SAM-dependent methyltransferase [Pyrinomonadaceae bacterium]